MNSSIWYQIAFGPVLLVLSGVFSALETAYLSLPSWRVSGILQRYPNGGKFVSRLLQKPLSLLVSILFVNTLINVWLSSLTETLAARLSPTYSVLISVAVVTPLLVLFGEILPKLLGLSFAERLSVAGGPFLSALHWLTTPARVLLEPLANGMAWLLGGDLVTVHRRISDEEFSTMLAVGAEGAEWGQEERQRLHRYLGFRELSAADIMKPRAEMVCTGIEDGIPAVIQAMKTSGYTRIPVYEGNVDTILGVAYNKIFLGLTPAECSQLDLRSLLQKPHSIPFSRNARGLLREMQRKGITIAFVIDEYGGCGGMLTMEDLLEELVGELYDEFDVEEKEVLQASTGSALILGTMSLKRVNEVFKTSFPETDVETIGGQLFSLLGHLPRRGESVRFEGVTLTAESVKGQKIELVRMWFKSKGRRDERK